MGLAAIVEAEVTKLVKLGFKEARIPHLDGERNVIKKNKQIRVCINFRDLNKAYLEENFLIIHIELLVYTTTSYEALSFVDGYLGYK